MSAASVEVINCRRFLSAWARVDAQEKASLDDDVVRQYQHLATRFQTLLAENEALRALETELKPVVREIEVLAERADSQPGVQTPAVSERITTMEETQQATPIKTTPVETEKKKTAKPVPEAPPVLRSDLVAEDFRAMLEVPTPEEGKLSTRAIRKRLGLADRSGAQTSASESAAREEQDGIQSDMIALAKQLKDRTQTINQTLTEDVKILDAVGQSAESNTALLDRENAKLKEQLASSIGLWTSLWLVAMLVIMFVVTYFYMRLFSRRW